MAMAWWLVLHIDILNPIVPPVDIQMAREMQLSRHFKFDECAHHFYTVTEMRLHQQSRLLPFCDSHLALLLKVTVCQLSEASLGALSDGL